MARKKTPEKTETELLMLSARKCCLCFGINHDLNEKSGQVAHLDQNATNNDIENLAWLCLPHHDKYDSRTSQSKGYREKEVKEYRSELYEFVAQLRSETQKKYKEIILQTNNDNTEISLNNYDSLIAEFNENQKNIDFPAIQERGRKIVDFIPKGWKIIANAEGSLQDNEDNDVAIVIQLLDSENVKIWEDFGIRSLDANPRILFILLKEGDEYKLIEQSNTFILSHEEFNMTDPFQTIEINEGVLQIDFELFSTMGSWSMSTASHKFKYDGQDFILINSDVNNLHRGSGEFERREYNFLTKTVLIKSGTLSVDEKEESRVFMIENLITLKTFKRPFELEIEKDYFI